ncbi:arylsulfatase A family protein [Galbibacter orientalis DSM 19592]|uniref:Arylsulfatase A family protein n=1 Tax=Galbibacter orientalis DSM 19592 TaxID=926559 RepID=I3CAX1_9FLAO|nr:arylsulfatase [Galbibacter orientalis]EIJ40764.1 arylsulfatase A family protein [Galbibacter orientalis DSM 19592]
MKHFFKLKTTSKLLLGSALVVSMWSCKNTKKQVVKNTETNIEEAVKPNIVFIYLDDLGYGDISANGATEISTPNIDNLAKGGVRFTNGYATSATCTPSRYGLLTGVYPWRNKDAQILPGTAPLIINTEQITIPKMLKKQGYQTGIVGKWHLGLGTGEVNWNERVSPGPNEVGFDYSYIMAATQDRVPTVYIKNGHVDGLDPNDPIEVNYMKNFEGEPTGKENPELLSMKWHHGHNNSIVNGIPRIGYMKGGEAAKWSDVDMADHFLNKAQTYVKEHKGAPFFLYYALQQPHVPRTPHPRFVGKSGMGPRGDVILEADWVIGEFIKTLEEENLLENTLIVLSSDNGPVLNDGYYDNAVEKLGKHTPTGGLRGGKYSLFDAGTRVPFLTYWKGIIKPTVSDALVCQIDLLSSLAELTGSDIKTDDSAQIIDAFLGKSKNGRTDLILEAGQKTALRSGNWVLIPPYKGQPINKQVNIELGVSSEYQLYNLKEDFKQQKNQASTSKQKLTEMIETYEKLRGTEKVDIKELELK